MYIIKQKFKTCTPIKSLGSMNYKQKGIFAQ